MTRSCARRSAAAIALLCSCAMESAVEAQAPAPAPLSNRFEAAIGGVWVGSGNMGASSATESVSSGPRFVLFSTSTQLDASLGLEARLGYHVTPVFEVDAVTSYAVPQLTTTISADTENGTPTTASVGVKQFTIGGSLVAHLTRFHVGPDGVPFVEAGAAYVRQVYDAPSTPVSGQMFEVGGGVKYIFSKRPGRRIGALGVRGDVRAVARRRGVAPDGGTHVSPAGGVSLFLSF
jgi:Outer membrane protein beta-barrel domain